MGEKNIGKDAKENTPNFSDRHKVIFKLNLHSPYVNRLTGGSGEVNQPAAVCMGSQSRKDAISHPAVFIATSLEPSQIIQSGKS